MAVMCEFIDFIVPIKNIDRVWDGGFKGFKEEFKEMFEGRYWHDKYLFRDGAMNPIDIRERVTWWEGYGLEGIVEVKGEKRWKDFCVVEGMGNGATLPCDWLGFECRYTPFYSCFVWYKGFPKGKVIGPKNR